VHELVATAKPAPVKAAKRSSNSLTNGPCTTHPLSSGHSLVTSLPDVSELGGNLERWRPWFLDAARRVIAACPHDGVAIFYQTDVKIDGHWVDKAHLCIEAAEAESVPMRWHKIVCRIQPGRVAFGRPSYAHLLCFAREHSLPMDRSTPDVLPDPGPSAWARGIGWNICHFVAGYVRDEVKSHTLVDPFCGLGTVLWVAHDLGLSAIGVDRSPKRCRLARDGLPPRLRGRLAIRAEPR
jgi:hypothetical protein